MTAFDNLQTAIDAASFCTTPQLWVAEGTYAPDPLAPVATISAPMSIYGGFAGDELTLEERDFVTHPVFLGEPGWQSRVVIIEDSAVDPVEPTRLDGFTIDGSDAGAIEMTAFQDFNPPVTVFLHNLEITNNLAEQGAGVLAHFVIGVEIVGSNFQGNVATSSGAAIYYTDSQFYIEQSTFVDNESPLGAIYEWYEQGLSHFGLLSLTDSVMSGNLGGAVHASSVLATNVDFIANSASNGGAVYLSELAMQATNCNFVDNQAEIGGAIYGTDSASIILVDSSFSGNSAQTGGAIQQSGGFNIIHLDISGGEFVANSASEAGGAILVPVSDTVIQGTTFRGNVAPRGGALHVVDNIFGTMQVAIADARFIANEATADVGGAISVQESMENDAEIAIVNSEFVANVAALDGGGIYGRTGLSAVTFANNLAGGTGDAFAAPPGPELVLRNVVAWPDDLDAPSLVLDHACVPTVLQPYVGINEVILLADPFAPDDLDLDGSTEYYLDPGSPCVDIGGTVDEFDWTVLTTQVSQCTDFAPVDAGVHYPPLFDAGPC
jgi:predicted outer membrane repeat protein